MHGHLYGTRAQHAGGGAGRTGADVLLDIDTQGAAQLRTRYPEAVLVFIVAPSMAELEQRLRERRSDAEGDIARRLERAREEIALWRRYDYLIVNRDSRRPSSSWRPSSRPSAVARRAFTCASRIWRSRTDGLSRRWKTRSTRCPTATCSSCSRPSAPASSTAAPPPRVETQYRKPTSTALEEIAAAKVEYRVKEEGEAAKGP